MLTTARNPRCRWQLDLGPVPNGTTGHAWGGGAPSCHQPTRTHSLLGVACDAGHGSQEGCHRRGAGLSNLYRSARRCDDGGLQRVRTAGGGGGWGGRENGLQGDGGTPVFACAHCPLLSAPHDPGLSAPVPTDVVGVCKCTIGAYDMISKVCRPLTWRLKANHKCFEIAAASSLAIVGSGHGVLPVLGSAAGGDALPGSKGALGAHAHRCTAKRCCYPTIILGGP
jgi:hypothetical protein